MTTTNNTRQETTFNKIVNFDKESGEITVLDYIFKHEDGFKGAVGTEFKIITKKSYDEILNEYLDNPQAVSEYWKNNIGECLTYDEIMEISGSEEEVIKLCGGLDDSYSELYDYLREELNLSEDEAFTFNCIGGGRCFDKDFEGNVNTELSQLIRDIEA